MLNLNRKEKREYSIRSAIVAAFGGQDKLTGVEKEVHQELEKDFPQRTGGVLIPSDIFQMGRRRDLNVTTFGQGGAFVETAVEPDVIPLLRNQLCCQRLGCKVISGLKGNVSIPRATAAATASAQSEQGAVGTSTQAVDQILLSPHRVSASTPYSRQLVLQSSVDVESFLRDDLTKITATKIDSMILVGQGGAEAVGILNTTGIGSLIFGGTASWQEIVAFETALSNANALGVPGAKLGWIVSPNTKGRWKAIAKTGIGVTSVVPLFLWDESQNFNDGSNDGRVNGYRAADTNQVLNNLVFFGNWSEVVLAQFSDGMEIIVDPYSLAQEATIRVTVNTFIDVAVRHPASFCVSEDAGNQ
jgi:HK97 family phage major capsid protein